MLFHIKTEPNNFIVYISRMCFSSTTAPGRAVRECPKAQLRSVSILSVMTFIILLIYITAVCFLVDVPLSRVEEKANVRRREWMIASYNTIILLFEEQ